MSHLEKSNYNKQEMNDQLISRLSLLEKSIYNGTMIWKIPDFNQRRRDAIANRVTFLHSLPFYTGRYGYKMCVRAYLNGDGRGHGTHLSLFLVLMKGNILERPFKHKVKIILLNQNSKPNIVSTFQPDPKSSSFQKPAISVAFGCPQFASHNLLGPSGGFVVENAIIILCTVVPN